MIQLAHGETVPSHSVLFISHNLYNSVDMCTVRYGTVRYGTVRYGTVRYGTVRYGTVRYGTVRYGTASSENLLPKILFW